MTRWRDKNKEGEDRSSALKSEDSVEIRNLSNAWLLYFSDLSAFKIKSESGVLL